MSVYRPTSASKVYWMDFVFAGQRVRETTRTRSKTVAREIERARRRQLEEGAGGVRRAARPKLFPEAADGFIAAHTEKWSASSLRMHRTALAHLKPVFGSKLVCDISAEDVSHYQHKRLAAGVSRRTINMEVGTLRGVLKLAGRWASIQSGVTAFREDPNGSGRRLADAEQTALLAACGESNARSLLPFVVLALETGARYGTIRRLQWGQVDFEARSIQWGRDKTQAGSGRVVPVNARALAVLAHWAAQFPGRQPEHYVFPYERIGGIGRSGAAGSRAAARFASAFRFGTDPTRPVGGIQHAWALAKRRAGVKCRFHDLRHTASSRMLAAGVPLSKIGKVLGWKPGTLALMVARYGHLGLEDLRDAVEAGSRAPEAEIASGSLKNPPNFFSETDGGRAN